MPIYEYQCGECGHRLEALQKMSDQPLQQCPACAKPALNKLISAAGFRLSGAGWYETDSKTGSKKNLTGGGESASPAASAATNSPAETKPAAKPVAGGQSSSQSSATSSAKSGAKSGSTPNKAATS